MPGGNPGLEDRLPVLLRDSLPVVEDDQLSVTPGVERGGDVYVPGPRVHGVTHELQESILYRFYAGRGTADAFNTGQPGEALAEIPVRPLRHEYSNRELASHLAHPALADDGDLDLLL